MSLAYELAKANVPGFQIRQALIQTGIDAERIRIIKLLSNECQCDGTSDGWNYCLAHKAIEIIKAENK